MFSKRWRAPSGGGRAQAAPTGDPRPSRARASWTRWSVVWCPISGTRCPHYCNSGCWQGWVTSDDPRKRQFEVKHGEAESIKAEMSSLARRRQSEHREIMSEVG